MITTANYHYSVVSVVPKSEKGFPGGAARQSSKSKIKRLVEYVDRHVWVGVTIATVVAAGVAAAFLYVPNKALW